MYNRAETRARQNRFIALVFTILVHIAVIGMIVYGKTGAKGGHTPAKATIEQQDQSQAAHVANVKRSHTKP